MARIKIDITSASDEDWKIDIKNQQLRYQVMSEKLLREQLTFVLKLQPVYIIHGAAIQNLMSVLLI